MTQPRVVVWFSCGRASAVAAHLALKRYGDRVVIAYCASVESAEHPDNARFIADCERWYGRPITRLCMGMRRGVRLYLRRLMRLKGTIRWPGEKRGKNARLVALNYSGGKQSTIMLEAVLRGELDPELPVYVLNADPGMEAAASYEHIERMRERCKAAGVYFETCAGPNLYDDLVNLPSSATRLDSPAYFTRDTKTGKRGMLRQKCTAVYKIAPMDRALRRIMYRDFHISPVTKRIPPGFVEKWIGFAADEVDRIKPPHQRYVTFRYPLVELGITRAQSSAWLESRSLPVPPRSVCNACFAHSPRDLKEMHDNRPADWAQAVAVDDAVRDWTQLGVRHPVYISDTLKPLRELAKENFGADDQGEGVRDACTSGYCFL